MQRNSMGSGFSLAYFASGKVATQTIFAKNGHLMRWLKTDHQSISHHIGGFLQWGQSDGSVVRVKQASQLCAAGLHSHGWFCFCQPCALKRAHHDFFDSACLCFGNYGFIRQERLKLLVQLERGKRIGTLPGLRRIARCLGQAFFTLKIMRCTQMQQKLIKAGMGSLSGG